MTNTRRQQQKLQVDKSGNGEASLSTSTSSGTATKRKQDSDNEDKVSHKEGKEKAKVGQEDAKDSNGTRGKDRGPPPAKAAKVDDGSQKDEASPASTHVHAIRGNSTNEGQAAGVEEKLDGKAINNSGSGDGVKWSVLERGHIYFFYRPKVQPVQDAKSNKPAAKSIDDTQNFHLLLLPRASQSSTAPAKSNAPEDTKEESEETSKVARKVGIGARLIRIGKKRLPEPKAAIKQGDTPGGIGGDSSEALWAVISDVSPSFGSLKAGIAERRYTTKTSGERVVQAARPVGRGWYVVSVSQTEPPSSREVRLSYALSHPHDDKDFGNVQEELGLHKESSILLQMRNPTIPATGAGAPPAGLDPSSRAQLSESELEETFGGNAEEKGTNYARPENIDLLDRAGVELLMIKKREQEVEDALTVGDTQQKTLKNLASQDAGSLSTIDVLKELGIEGQNPPDALDGDWF